MTQVRGTLSKTKKEERRRLYQERREQSTVQRQFGIQTDIKTIMQKMRKGAEVSTIDPTQFIQGDMLHMPKDLHEVYDKIKRGQDAFFMLPAEVRRKEFDNDPINYLKMVSDPKKNQKDLKRLGLLKEPKKRPDPQRVVIVDDKTKKAEPPSAATAQ